MADYFPSAHNSINRAKRKTKVILYMLLNTLSPMARRQAVNKRPKSHIWHSIPFTTAQLTLGGASEEYGTLVTNTTKHLLWRSAFGIDREQLFNGQHAATVSYHSECCTACKARSLARPAVTHSQAHMKERRDGNKSGHFFSSSLELDSSQMK